MELRFESIGQGPPVVLVHGAAPIAWGTIPQRLAHDYRVITYGRRGFPPHEHLAVASSLREHSDDLEEVLGRCGPGTVVGWSSGGVVALDLALRRRDLVSRLVILEAPLHARRHPSLGSARAVLGAQVKRRRSAERGARYFLTWALGRSDGKPSDITHLDPEALRRAADAIVNELPHATGEREIALTDLDNLAVDTSWLVGTASVRANKKLAIRSARRSTRITVYEVPGSGHAIWLDAPDAVVAAIGADNQLGTSPLKPAP